LSFNGGSILAMLSTIWARAGWLTIGFVVAACAGGARPSGHDGARPPFDAERVRLGRFHYENTMEGKSAGSSTISVARAAPDRFRFRNEVVGTFRQTWECESNRALEPAQVTLGFGERDDRGRRMRLLYRGSQVSGTATHVDKTGAEVTESVSSTIPTDIVDQRVDWAALMSAPLAVGQRHSFSVYDPWSGLSRVDARVEAGGQTRVPAGAFDTFLVVYRIDDPVRGAHEFRAWVSEATPRFLVRELFPNGSVTELARIEE
jgi:hypothetical protein